MSNLLGRAQFSDYSTDYAYYVHTLINKHTNFLDRRQSQGQQCSELPSLWIHRTTALTVRTGVSNQINQKKTNDCAVVLCLDYYYIRLDSQCILNRY